MNRGVLSLLRDSAATAHDVFGWWRGELRELAQALLRKLPSRKSPEILLRVGAGAISVERREGAGSKVVGTASVGADGAWPAELPGLPAELRGARTAIVMPDSELFSCEFDLPLAAEAHLSAVLGLQLERSLPLPLDRVLIDRQILARDRQRETLRVRAVVAHRDRVESLRERVLGWGLTPVSAGVIGLDGTPVFNLLKRRRDPIRWSLTALDLRLFKIAGVAASLLVVLIGIQWTRERLIVNSQRAEVHAEAMKISAARAGVVERARPLLALQSIAGSPAAPDLLAKLSIAVPESAWFSRIDLMTPMGAPGTIKLTGSVASQEEVTAALRTLPGVRNLKTSSAFNGEILGRQQVEFEGEFVPAVGDEL
jgi:hypothetical protein